ncbi:MAG: AraC family transcriptional regulator [Acetobacteraceae bacterium]|nr:AraC family transcriptional regulator [Acetobacteraceae bacterium]
MLARLALFELAEAEDGATFMPMPSDPRARRVAEMVLAEPAGARELDDLARTAGASARTITRLFPVETDLTCP